MLILQVLALLGVCFAFDNKAWYPSLQDDLMSPDGPMKRCFKGTKHKSDRVACARTVFRHERSIRRMLEKYVHQVARAQMTMPLLSNMINQISADYNASSSFVNTDLMNRLHQGEVALEQLEVKHQEEMFTLLRDFETIRLYSGNVGKFILDQNTGLLSNITTALTGLLANQTDERKAELTSIQASYESSRNQIVEDARKFATEFSLSLDALDAGIKVWQGDQKGNLTLITDSVRTLDAALRQKQTNFTSQLRTLSSQLYTDAVTAIQAVRDDELLRLGDANTAVHVALNKTNNELNAQIADSDLTLRNEDREYADSLRAKVVDLQQGVLGAYDGLYKLAKELSMNITAGQNSIKNEQAGDQVKLDQILSDIANATEVYSNVADSTKTQGLLTTRKVLATLARMLDEVKAAMTAQESSFATEAGTDLLNSVNTLQQASEEAKKAAGGAAAEVGGNVADAAFLAGMNTQEMFGTMGKLLMGISKLSDLIKAKVGQEADRGSAMLATVNNVIGGATGDLAGSLAAVASANKARNLQLQQQNLGMTTDVKLQGAEIMSDFQTELNTNMNAMDKVYNDARVAGLNAVGGSNTLVSHSQQAVGALQDATLALDGVVGQSAARAQAAWGGADDVVTAGEQAAAQALNEAGQVLKTFVTTQATNRGNRLVQIAQVANTTFRGAFENFAAQVTDSNRVADLGFQTVLTGGQKVTGDLNAYEGSLQALIDQLSLKNKTTVDMLVTLKNQSQAVWDAWVQEQLVGYRSRIGASDAELEKEFSDRLTSVGAVATNMIAGARDKLTSVTQAIMNTTGEARAAAVAASQSLANIATTEAMLTSDANATRTKLTASNEAQKARFAALAQTLSAVVSGLLAKTATASESIISRNKTVFDEIFNATQQVQDEVSADTRNFGEFVGNFTNKVRTTRDIMNNYEKDQSSRRLEVIQSVVNTMNQAKNDLVGRVLSGNLENYEMMSKFSEILNDIADAQKSLAAGSATAASSLDTNVGNLMQTVYGLKDSMIGELSSSFDRLSREAGLEASQAVALGQSQMAAQSGAVSGIGNQVLNLIDGVIQANEVNGVGLSQDQVAVFKLASMVQGLSTESSAQLRELMAKISNGVMTLDQALAEATTVNANSLQTIGDVASAFSSTMSDYLSETATFFGNVNTNITTYNASTMAKLDAYNTTHAAAVTPMFALVMTARALVEKFVTDVDKAVNYGKNNMTFNEQTLTNVTVAVEDAYANITSKINEATSTINAIKQDEIIYVETLLTEAKKNVTTELNTMLTTYFPNDADKSAALDAVIWTLPKIAF